MNAEYNENNTDSWSITDETAFKYQSCQMIVWIWIGALIIVSGMIVAILNLDNSDAIGIGILLLLIGVFFAVAFPTSVELTSEGLRVERAFLFTRMIQWPNITRMYMAFGQATAIVVTHKGGRLEIPVRQADLDNPATVQFMQNIAAVAGLRKSPDSHILPSYER